jgi:hypothetical protein
MRRAKKVYGQRIGLSAVQNAARWFSRSRRYQIEAMEQRLMLDGDVLCDGDSDADRIFASSTGQIPSSPSGAIILEMEPNDSHVVPQRYLRHGGTQQRRAFTRMPMASSFRRRALACDVRVAAFLRWVCRITSAALRNRSF